MKINIGNGITERSAVIKPAQTFVSGNLKKESVMLDKDGNEIDRRTKRVVKLNE